ncbi:uncharacterized protein [Epargyreus clarus]|uniref:uncharacterized protein n=1 Tax=Epargyreus clarus TaxID=520877 RepID=UPI003C2D194E
MSQSCRIKMLRYLYLLSLLICFNISFCYEYTSDNESRNSQSRKIREAANLRYRKRNVEQGRVRKRHDYDMGDMAYDKDPVAQIDVANFIKSAEDESFGENDPYEFQHSNIKHLNNYNDYGNLDGINSDEKAYNNEDYSDVNAESPHENPPNLNLDATSTENKGGKAIPGFDSTLKKKLDDESFSKSNVHYQQKKCALKNIKLPFFSHNKSATTKGKKNKKRKLYGFTKLRKGKTPKENSEKLPSKSIVPDPHNPYKYYKINKRSYIERLCPACKRKFIMNQKFNVKDKRKNLLKNTYNTRELNNDESYSENVNKNTNTYKFDMDDNNKEVDFKESWRDRRRKREDDNRNIERQKELDDLERRVESVTVTHPSYNKADSKS